MASASFPHPVISRSPSATDNHQLEIVKANGLNPLLRLLQSPDPGSISSAVSCIGYLSGRYANGSLIIEAGFLQPLVKLLAFKDSEMVQYCAAGALRNLAASIENRGDIVNAGTVQSIKELVLHVPVRIQIQMTYCIECLSSSGMHSPLSHVI